MAYYVCSGAKLNAAYHVDYWNLTKLARRYVDETDEERKELERDNDPNLMPSRFMLLYGADDDKLRLTRNYATLWTGNNVIGNHDYIENGCTVLFWELKCMASSNDENIEAVKPCIIFPLLTKPLNDLNSSVYPGRYWGSKAGGNSATYSSLRPNKRQHAGRDLYGQALSTQVVAICDGVVLENRDFYNGTYQVTVLHTTHDGRKFIIRYGEVDSNSISVTNGQNVKQGQEIARIGKLINQNGKQNQIDGKVTNMLHLEYFTGNEGYDINKPLSTPEGKKPDNDFKRRKDVADPLNILIEGYDNTFNNK
jgi:murein DD-endopeptidase MepM/ murein hydrolase activator NlpD